MPTLREQLAEGALFRLTPQWRMTIRRTEADVSEMLRRCERPYVALSWGKQSIVMAHVVYSVSRSVPCVHWTGPDAELIGDFRAVSAAFLARWPLQYVELQRGEKLAEAIAAFDTTSGHDGVFVGLSAFESRGRRMTIRNSDHRHILRYADGRFRCCPLADWGIVDLAAYIGLHDLPLLEPYRRYGLDVRTSTGCREGGRTEGAIDLMRSGDAAEMRKRWRERACH